MPVSLLTRRLDPEAIRKDFPILNRVPDDADSSDSPLAYLDNASTTHPPRQVVRGMVEIYRRHYCNVHRGTYCMLRNMTALYEQVRVKARAFLNAPAAEQIIFTSGTTHAINLVARSWGDANMRRGDEILLSQMEHHANIVPWQQLAERCGAVVRFIPVSDDGLLDLDAMDRLLSDRTRLVGVTGASNVLGTITPVEQIVRRAHAAGAVVLLDAAQSVPHQRTDVAASGVDFLALSAHKMLGPNGVGLLYGRRELLEAMPPFSSGGGMVRDVTPGGYEAEDLPAKFEAGTPPIVPVIGFGAAIDYLTTIGMEAIADHQRRLAARAYEMLSAIRGLRLMGPRPEHRLAVFSFTLRNVPAAKVAHVLDRRGIAVCSGHHCTIPLHRRFGLVASVRASFALYNTLAEVDRLGQALEAVEGDCRTIAVSQATPVARQTVLKS
jgi:cysteine desulfurase/selenocysteine lyase